MNWGYVLDCARQRCKRIGRLYLDVTTYGFLVRAADLSDLWGCYPRSCVVCLLVNRRRRFISARHLRRRASFRRVRAGQGTSHVSAAHPFAGLAQRSFSSSNHSLKATGQGANRQSRCPNYLYSGRSGQRCHSCDQLLQFQASPCVWTATVFIFYRSTLAHPGRVVGILGFGDRVHRGRCLPICSLLAGDKRFVARAWHYSENGNIWQPISDETTP